MMMSLPFSMHDVCAQEMAFAAACLSQDAKNYHAWAHRQVKRWTLSLDLLWLHDEALCAYMQPQRRHTTQLKA